MPAVRYALLLRGVNVGGRSTLPMADLRRVLTGLGLDDVATYLQSGQAVVTDPEGTAAAALAGRVEAALAGSGLTTRVLALTHQRLGRVVGGSPYPAPEAAPTQHVVWFPFEPVSGDVLNGVDVGRFAPEECAVAGGVIYLRLPNGQGRSRLLPVLQRAIRVATTARNWNTVLKLHELTGPR